MSKSERFILSVKEGNGLCVYDTKTGKSYWYAANMCSLINELSEKNDEYAKIIEQAKRYEKGLWDRFTMLEKENRKLHEKVKQLQKIAKRTEEEKEHYADLYYEQQATIDKLQANIQYLIDTKKELLEKMLKNIEKLEKENRELRTKLTIYKKSNNDILYEQESEIKKWKEENRKLRKELNDCEKFRYQIFKRMEELHDE